MTCCVSIHVLFMLNWKHNTLNPVAVHGAEPHQDRCLGHSKNNEVPFSLLVCLAFRCLISGFLHQKIMIVCLFGLFSDCNGHFINTNINGDPPPRPALCSLSVHTTVYPINSFTIYNYLFFSVIQKQEHSNKRGIKLGLVFPFQK